MYINEILHFLRQGYKASASNPGILTLGPITEGARTPMTRIEATPKGEAAIGLTRYIRRGWLIEDFNDHFVILAPPRVSETRVFVRVA